MNDYIVRSKNADELSKHGNISYRARFMDILILQSTLSIEEIREIEGVYSVERNDVLGCLCG
jgi:hypothetical protein